VPGIQVPDYPISELRDRSLAAVEAMRGDRRVIVYGCEQGPDLAAVRSADVATLALPCIGMLPPSFIDFMLSREHVDGVVLTGCRPGDCHHRFGNLWMIDRLSRTRDPHLRWRVPGQRVRTVWSGVTGTPQLVKTVADLHADLPDLPRHAQRTTVAEPGARPEPVP
jgi:coenzyme F420-reducing hydrogenase delta subunit